VKVLALVIVLALAPELFAARAVAFEAPDEGCAADAKPANLNFTLKDLNGKNVPLSAYKGQVVLLDFWATWCPPCRREIPGFIDLYTQYKSQGLVVLGVSMDDSTSDVKKFARELRMNYPIVLGYGRDDVEKAFGPLPGMPTSFIIARDGRICGRHTGFVAKETFERAIKGLL